MLLHGNKTLSHRQEVVFFGCLLQLQQYGPHVASPNISNVAALEECVDADVSSSSYVPAPTALSETLDERL